MKNNTINRVEIRKLMDEVVHLDSTISKLDEVDFYFSAVDSWQEDLDINISIPKEFKETFNESRSFFDIFKPSNWSRLFKKDESEDHNSWFFNSASNIYYSIEEQIDRLLDEYSKTGDYRILDKIRSLRDFDKQQFQDFLLKKKVKLKKRLSFIKRKLTLVNYIINLRTAFLKKIKHVIKKLDDEHELIFN